MLPSGRRSVACPAIWREAAVTSGNSVGQLDRISRVCCRFPADRGASHAPTPSGQTPFCGHMLLILAVGRSPACRRSAGARQKRTEGETKSHTRRAESKADGRLRLYFLGFTRAVGSAIKGSSGQ